MHSLIPAAADALPAVLAPSLEAAADYLRASSSPATVRAYATDWQRFASWCADKGQESAPASPAIVALFLSDEARAGRKASTITRRAAAIAFRHRALSLPSPIDAPAVKKVLAGIRRTHGTNPRRVSPVTAERLAVMLEGCGDDLHGLRNRAMLTVGFGAALRRSELAALRVEDVEEVPEGLRVRLPRSKTDQEGAGQEVAVLDGPRLRVKAALAAWKAAAGITTGYLFRGIDRGGRVSPEPLTTRTVANVVKERAEAAGLDPSQFSGHSLRAGFLTSAAAHGAGLFAMLAVSRHRSIETVRGYVRRAEAFKDHAGSAFM